MMFFVYDGFPVHPDNKPLDVLTVACNNIGVKKNGVKKNVVKNSDVKHSKWVSL
jgi:hypothetical protein